MNAKIHRIHKSPPLVPIPSRINPVHTTPSYLSETIAVDMHAKCCMDKNCIHTRTFCLERFFILLAIPNMPVVGISGVTYI
jgi:hypothetical protein